MLTPNIQLNGRCILITGAAGFIGAALVEELFRSFQPIKIVGVDNMSDYYDVSIKQYRLCEIEKAYKKHPGSEWTFIKGDISDKSFVEKLFSDRTFGFCLVFLLRSIILFITTL